MFKWRRILPKFDCFILGFGNFNEFFVSEDFILHVVTEATNKSLVLSISILLRSSAKHSFLDAFDSKNLVNNNSRRRNKIFSSFCGFQLDLSNPGVTIIEPFRAFPRLRFRLKRFIPQVILLIFNSSRLR